MQMSTTRHSSTISMVLTAVSLTSVGTGSGVFAVASCTGGVSGGRIGDGSGNAASTVDAGSTEATTIVSGAVSVTGAAAIATSPLATAALAATALPIAVT